MSFRTFDIMETIAELMLDDELLRYPNDIYCEFRENTNEAGERVYSELHTGNWWRRSDELLRDRSGVDSYVLPIILYLDGTQLDVTGKECAKPVCITLGNFSGKLRVCYFYIVSNLF